MTDHSSAFANLTAAAATGDQAAQNALDALITAHTEIDPPPAPTTPTASLVEQGRQRYAKHRGALTTE